MAQTTVTVTVTTPAGVTVQNVLDTLCPYWGYTGFLPDGVTPQTQAQFVQARLAAFLRQSYIDARVAADVVSTRQSSAAAAGQVAVS